MSKRKLENFVSGSELKKIKTLSHILNEDEKQNNEIVVTQKVESFKFPSISVDKSDVESDSASENECDDLVDELTTEDRAALDKYLNTNTVKPLKGDLAAIRAKVAHDLHEEDVDKAPQMNWAQIPGMAEAFENVAVIMTRYTKTQRLPKIVKCMPQFVNLKEFLEKADFFNWSATGVARICPLFRSAASLKTGIFYQLFLVPYLQNYINTHNRLNDALYLALKDTTFRPHDFIKSVLCPWVASNELTGRCAVVLASVIQSSRLKPDNAEIVMKCFVTKLPPNKSRLIVLQSLLGKKYEFTTTTVQQVARFFCLPCFVKADEFPECLKVNATTLVNLWHECIYEFVQVYSTHLEPESLTALGVFCSTFRHQRFTPQIQEFLRLATKARTDSVMELDSV